MNKFNKPYIPLKENEKYILLNWQCPKAIFNNWQTMINYINSDDFIFNCSMCKPNLDYKIVKEL